MIMFEQKIVDVKREKIVEDLKKAFTEYQKALSYFASDVPIEILGLTKELEDILLANGIIRVYDTFNVDFRKVEWLDDSSRERLTTRLNQFFSML